MPGIMHSSGLRGLVLAEVAVLILLGTYAFYMAINGQTMWWGLFTLAVAAFLLGSV